MSTLLLDASVWVAAFASDEAHHAASLRLIATAEDAGRSLAALDLTFYEVANVFVVRRQSAEEARDAVKLVSLGSKELERADAELLGHAAEIAGEHGISVYDAAYVAAARRNGWRLISLDVADLISKGLAELPQ